MDRKLKEEQTCEAYKSMVRDKALFKRRVEIPECK